MKTIKLHRTASESWRLLIDGQVHPLMVGMLTLVAAMDKLVLCYNILGAFSFESLKAMESDLKMYLEQAWAHTDTVDKNVLDVRNARMILTVKMLKWYPEEMKQDAAINVRVFNLKEGEKFSELMADVKAAGMGLKGLHLKRKPLIVQESVTATESPLSKKHNPTDEQKE